MAELFVGGAVDPASHERTGDNTIIETEDLTTHGVIVGMTGSGKTGLGVVLLEEVLAAGLPALVIDPKGDLTNLCLTFPELRAEDFRPWVDESQAKAAGVSADEFAEQQATAWRDGLASWGITGERIASLLAATELTVYTPGSRAGLPMNLVGSLDPPGTDDEEIVGDEVEGFVSGLLGLVGIDADPLSSREHILLSNLVHHAWSNSQRLDLAGLVAMIQAPPLRKLGVFELDEFFPAKDRTELAMSLNGLLASPSFAAWAQGEPLDIQSLLYAADGRPRCAIVTTAHLSDEERQFVTALVLGKLVTWMRRQSGVSNLRALLYMDEVTGYLPPTANPPTKRPIMTLMKQARAFGVGVVLATQNPVDVDYKALSNAGTWMVGRLQTERDKSRLIDGMSAAAGGVDIRAVGDTISGLAKREFVLRRAGKDQPETFTTRWAMSYLRGPLTRDQIATLMASRKEPERAAEPEAATAPPESATTTTTEPTTTTTEPTTMSVPADASAAAAAPAAERAVMPDVAGGIAVRYADPAAPWLATVGASPGASRLAPSIVTRVAVRYDERSAGDLVHETEYEAVLFPLRQPIDVTTAVAVDYDDRDLLATATAGAVYQLGGEPIAEKSLYSGVERDLAEHLARTMTYDVEVNRKLDAYSRPGETSDEFAARCTAAANERGDAEVAKLRDKYEAKVAKLRTQIDATQDRAAAAETDARADKRDDLLSMAGSVLGGLLRGRGSLGSILGQAGRSRSRTAERRSDEAQDRVAALNDELADLEAELAEEVTTIGVRCAELAKSVETMSVSAEKSDIRITHVALVWLPVE